MSIPVTPVRIALDALEIEAPLEAGVLPGMVLRLESPGEAPAFAEVRSVDVLSDALRVSLSVLQGSVGLSVTVAHVLDDDALCREVQARSGKQQALLVPLFDAMNVDLAKLGTLSVVSGEPFESKFQAMLGLMQGLTQYRKLLVIDPLGVFEEEDGVLLLQAGEDVKLSIQSLGLSRFLEVVVQTVPEPAQAEALQVLMRHAPISPDFIPFKRFLNLDKADDSAVKSVLLYNLYEIYSQHVFADQPEDEFDPGAIETKMTVLDLSTLKEPWKSLFYRQILIEWLRESAMDLVPVLIYPERYLDSLVDWVPKAESQGLNLLAMVSPYEDEDLSELADNWLDVREDGRLEICGALTYELPVRVSLDTLHREAEDRLEAMMAEPDLSFPVEEEVFQFELARSQPLDVPLPAPEESSALREHAAPAEPIILPAPAATTWESLGWQPPTEFPVLPEASPEPVSAPSVTEDDAPVYDSILGDVRALESPSPTPSVSRQPAPEASDLPTGFLDVENPASLTDQDFSNFPPDLLTVEDSIPLPGAVEPSSEASLPEEATLTAGDEELDFALDDLDEWDASSDEFETDNLSSSPMQGALLNEALTDDADGSEPSFDDLGVRWNDDETVTVAESLTEPKTAESRKTWTSSEPPPVQDEVPVYQTRQLGQEEAGDDYNIGDHVRHPKHGVGVIQKKIPMDGHVILNIQFEALGKCLVDPRLASLEKI